MAYWDMYPPRQTVGARRAKAKRALDRAAKSGKSTSPVVIEGRAIARTLWGKAWCENLERYSDYANRLPRGRSYVRNGAVIDLSIARGEVRALVQGTRLYEVEVRIAPLAAEVWSGIVAECAGQIGSLVDLLRGQLSTAVMQAVTRAEGGLFPRPKEIAIECSCPDWATLCKHACAVLYGIGARFDLAPELLFELRGTDPSGLIAAAAASNPGSGRASADVLEEDDLGSLFGIDLEDLGTARETASAVVAGATPAVVAPAHAKRRASATRAEAAQERGGGAHADRATAAKNGRAKAKRAAADAPAKAAAKSGRAKAKRAAADAPAKAAAKSGRAKAKRAAANRATRALRDHYTRGELIALGVPPGTISTWARAGVLRATRTRGTYAITADARRRLAAYLA